MSKNKIKLLYFIKIFVRLQRTSSENDSIKEYVKIICTNCVIKMTNQLKGNKRFLLTVHKRYLCPLISHLCPLKRRQIRYKDVKSATMLSN